MTLKLTSLPKANVQLDKRPETFEDSEKFEECLAAVSSIYLNSCQGTI